MPGKPGELGEGFFMAEARYVSNFRDNVGSKSVADPEHARQGLWERPDLPRDGPVAPIAMWTWPM